MEEIYALRMVRAGFLDVAIEIEADLRVMLIDYFLTEARKVGLFWDFYESKGTLAPSSTGSRRCWMPSGRTRGRSATFRPNR